MRISKLYITVVAVATVVCIIFLFSCRKINESESIVATESVAKESAKANDCPEVFFEPVGDLPGDAVLSELYDMSADGKRITGGSSADVPSVDNDGGSASGLWQHALMAFGWTRPCENVKFFSPGPSGTDFPPGNTGIGMIGLGYLLTGNDIHEESFAYGISPDGETIVGGCNVGIDYHSEAVLFRLNNITKLDKLLPGDLSGEAKDVSDNAPGKMTNNAARESEKSTDLSKSGKQISGVIVGWTGPGNNHPSRTPNARAVYWDPWLNVHALPLPSTLPNTKAIESCEAFCISNDGTVIAGELYYLNSTGHYNAYACVWRFNGSTGTYGLPTVLNDLPGGEIDARAFYISGNGDVIVGYSVTGAFDDPNPFLACRWRFQGGAWGNPVALPPLPGMSWSTANGVNFSGNTIIGSSGNYIDNRYGFEEKATVWNGLLFPAPTDIIAKIKSENPSVTIPVDWQLEGRRISATGKVFSGLFYFPDSSKPADPNAILWEGWVGRIH